MKNENIAHCLEFAALTSEDATLKKASHKYKFSHTCCTIALTEPHEPTLDNTMHIVFKYCLNPHVGIFIMLVQINSD